MLLIVNVHKEFGFKALLDGPWQENGKVSLAMNRTQTDRTGNGTYRRERELKKCRDTQDP